MGRKKLQFTTYGWVHVGIKIISTDGEPLKWTCPALTGIDYSGDLGLEQQFGCRNQPIGVGEGNATVTGSIRMKPEAWFGERGTVGTGLAAVLQLAFGINSLQETPAFDMTVSYGDDADGVNEDFHSVTIKQMRLTTLDQPQSQGDTSFEVSLDFLASNFYIDLGTDAAFKFAAEGA